MRVMRVRNVGEALPVGVNTLLSEGEWVETRNGKTCRLDEPMTTVYGMPQERVLFDERRDANPFFHLMESLWMLAGRNDLAFVERFARQMRAYSDDGSTLWGAYGYRWRSQFDTDQLLWAVDRLAANPNDRRVVLTMWDARTDPMVADAGGKDVPCNVAMKFAVRDGAVNMTVWNRSNDIVWGAYGANAVHMSILQEFVAQAIGARIGRYWQVSDDWHMYDSILPKVEHLKGFDELAHASADPYANKRVQPFNLMASSGVHKTWLEDLDMFLDEPTALGFRHAFFRKIAKPMLLAHRAHDNGDLITAREILGQMPAGNDWSLAGLDWVNRHKPRKEGSS